MKEALIVCFTGMDGTGKTTLAKSLEKSIKNSGISCKYIWCGWKGFESFLFSPIAKIIRNNRESKGGARMRGASIQNNLLFTYAAWLDYFLRIFPNLLVSLYKYDLIILDRYIYDVAIGFSINTDREGKELLRRFFYIFPKPDITFLIDVPEEVAYTRKDDIPSIEYIAKQRAMYLKLLEEYNIHVLDGTKSKEELLSVVKMEVTKIE